MTKKRKICSTRLTYTFFHEIGPLILVLFCAAILFSLLQHHPIFDPLVVGVVLVLSILGILLTLLSDTSRSLVSEDWRPFRNDLYLQGDSLYIGERAYREREILGIDLRGFKRTYRGFHRRKTSMIHVLRITVQEDAPSQYHFIAPIVPKDMLLLGRYSTIYHQDYQQEVLSGFQGLLGDHFREKTSATLSG